MKERRMKRQQRTREEPPRECVCLLCRLHDPATGKCAACGEKVIRAWNCRDFRFNRTAYDKAQKRRRRRKKSHTGQ